MLIGYFLQTVQLFGRQRDGCAYALHFSSLFIILHHMVAPSRT
jgi:hypothetical protein